MRRTLLLLLLSTPALAQTAPPAGNQLNQLLDALHAAPSPEIAQALEAQLEEVWLNAGSPAVRLLMGRGLRELKASNYKEAVEAFGDVVTLDPNSPEGYRQLALSRYAAGDPRGAIEDLALAVQHEPRDFLAYKSLSEIAEQQQDWKGAYEAWQKSTCPRSQHTGRAATAQAVAGEGARSGDLRPPQEIVGLEDE